MEEKLPTQEDYQTALEKIRNNEPSFKDLNLNNLVDSKPEWMNEIFKALERNSCKYLILFFFFHISFYSFIFNYFFQMWKMLIWLIVKLIMKEPEF